MGKYVCPHCDSELECILVVERTELIFDGEERSWSEDAAFKYSDADFRCSECEGTLDFNDLEAKGVL